MKRYGDDGFVKVSTFEELITDLLQEKIYSILKKQFILDKYESIVSINPVGMYEDTNVMKVEITFKDRAGTTLKRQVSIKLALKEGEGKRLLTWVDSSNLCYEYK